MKKTLSLLFLLVSAGIAAAQTQPQVQYKKHCKNVFCVELPTSFKVSGYPDNDADHESYTVTVKGFEMIELNATIESRIDFEEPIDNIQEWYQYSLKKHPEATYKMQKDNWFVLSGVTEKGDIYYWKKIWQGEFICDMYIEYPKSKKADIEPYLSKIAKSLTIHWVESGQ